jgi:hypothetical protein
MYGGMRKQMAASSPLTSLLTGERETASTSIAATFRRAIGNVRPGYWLFARVLSGYPSLGFEICGATTILVGRKVTSHGLVA